MAHYSLSEYETMAQELRDQGESAHWAMGDLLTALTADYGDKAINTIANLLRVAPGTLRKKRLVALRFTPDQRLSGLPWSMHEAVAYVDDTDRRAALLEQAHDDGWTTDQLRREARGQDRTTPPINVERFTTRMITALLQIAEENSEATMLSVLRDVMAGTGANLEGLEG
jgi:hypothetical protein